MRPALFTFAALLFACAPALAQNAKPEFEAADVHVSAPGANPQWRLAARRPR